MAGVNYSINVASGTTDIYCGKFDQPALIADLQPGFWAEATGTNLSAVYEPVETRLAGNPAFVMDAWCGAAYDTDNQRLVIMLGGGHNDYKGNETYSFDIRTLTWSRPISSSSDYTNCSEFAGDGKPAAAHTYNMSIYVPSLGYPVMFGGSSYGTGCADYPHVVSVNIDAGTWDTSSYADMTNMEDVQPAVTAAHPTTGHCWHMPGFGGPNWHMKSWNPLTDTWTTHYQALGGIQWYSTAAIDPVNNNMVTCGGSVVNRQLWVWDLDNPTNTITNQVGTGDNAPETFQAPGFIWDPVVKKFVAWIGGTDIYVLDPTTWVWTLHTDDASNTVTPGAVNTNGTYGRFFYDPTWDVYGVVNSTTTNVFFFKRPGSVT